MWFLNQLQEGHAVYNMPMTLRLTGALDRAALRQALDDVTRRHVVLRTAVPALDGVPHPVILTGEAARPEFAVVEAGEDELADLLHAEARRPFDVGRELPIR